MRERNDDPRRDRQAVAPQRPRPSRHQVFTPNSSAPPEATSPGRMVSICHSRSPASATSARHQRQHHQAAAQRHRAPDRGTVDAQHHHEVGPWRRPRRVAARLQPELLAHRPVQRPPRGQRHRARRRRRPTATSTSTPIVHETQSAGLRRRRPGRAGSAMVGLRSRSAAQVAWSRPGPRRRRASSDHDGAEDRDAVRAAAYALGQPARPPARARVAATIQSRIGSS